MNERLAIPRSMEDLLPVLGEQALAGLSCSYPGVIVKIPKAIQSDHPLAQAIGLEAASRLVKHHGGGRIYIPSAIARAKRDRAIVDARQSGDGVAEIALRHGLTSRQVERILAKSRRGHDVIPLALRRRGCCLQPPVAPCGDVAGEIEVGSAGST